MTYDEKKQVIEEEGKKTIRTGMICLTALFIFCVLGGMWGCPKYNVWQQGLAGQAELERATQNRQIKIQEALAAKDAASSLAEADTIRARGVAISNQIIGSSLKNNEAYLHWLWIDNLEKNPNAVIYVPTEANMPIMEAGRFIPKPPQPVQ